MTCKLAKYALSVGQDKWCGFQENPKPNFAFFGANPKNASWLHKIHTLCGFFRSNPNRIFEIHPLSVCFVFLTSGFPNKKWYTTDDELADAVYAWYCNWTFLGGPFFTKTLRCHGKWSFSDLQYFGSEITHPLGRTQNVRAWKQLDDFANFASISRLEVKKQYHIYHIYQYHIYILLLRTSFPQSGQVVTEVKIGERELRASSVIAGAFNSHFSRIDEDLANKIPNSDVDLLT